MVRTATLVPTLCAFAAATLLLTAGCDSNDPGFDWSDIAEVRISPDSASIPVGETVDFSFTLHTETGELIEDVDLNTRWESLDTSVFTVADNGLATAVAPGTSKCVIEVSSYPISEGAAAKTGRSAAAGIRGFVGQDSARVVVF